MEDRSDLLARIASALERLAPPPPSAADLGAAPAHRWRPGFGVRPVDHPDALPLDLLLGVERQRDALLANTRRFASGAQANNALLWGSRGTGKSALVKAVFAATRAHAPDLRLVEVARADAARLDELLPTLQDVKARVILFIDDLSFEPGDEGLKALKPVLDGGVGGRPENTILYATSNQRHLVGATRARTLSMISFGPTPRKTSWRWPTASGFGSAFIQSTRTSIWRSCARTRRASPLHARTLTPAHLRGAVCAAHGPAEPLGNSYWISARRSIAQLSGEIARRPAAYSFYFRNISVAETFPQTQPPP